MCGIAANLCLKKSRNGNPLLACYDYLNHIDLLIFRKLKILVEFDPDEILSQDCVLHLQEELPSGAFVNPDEINDLNRNDKVSI